MYCYYYFFFIIIIIINIEFYFLYNHIYSILLCLFFLLVSLSLYLPIFHSSILLFSCPIVPLFLFSLTPHLSLPCLPHFFLPLFTPPSFSFYLPPSFTPPPSPLTASFPPFSIFFTLLTPSFPSLPHSISSLHFPHTDGLVPPAGPNVRFHLPSPPHPREPPQAGGDWHCIHVSISRVFGLDLDFVILDDSFIFLPNTVFNHIFPHFFVSSLYFLSFVFPFVLFLHLSLYPCISSPLSPILSLRAAGVGVLRCTPPSRG